MKSLLTAAALALSLGILTPAVAQEQTADAAVAGMAQLGMDTEGLVLTDEQVLQITAILNDAGMEDELKVRQINDVLGREG